jgi:hypothetical protein
MVLFAILALLGILLAILSLRGDRAFAEYVRTFLERLSDDRIWPAATVMVPVKGLTSILPELASWPNSITRTMN